MSIRNMMIGSAGATAPDAPTIGTATSATSTTASVTFSAPANNGGSAITGFTVTSSPSGITGTGASSPITVSGLSTGTAYTFTVTATNAVGTSPASSASNSVTPSAPTSLPAYIAQGESGWLASPTGTKNSVKYRMVNPSAGHSLGTSVSSDSHNYYVTDYLGWYWYIAANWGYGTMSRWGATNRMGMPGSGAASNPAYTTLDGRPIYNTNMNGTTKSSGTGANAITFSDNDASNNEFLKPGSFQYDAQNFTNGSGPGWTANYGDGNKANQTYPGIVTNVYNNYNNGTYVIQNFDNGSSQGSNDGGQFWWRPPLLTKEVAIDFGDQHSNSPCRVWCWDNTNGVLKWLIGFGNFGAVDTTAGAINDSYTRTIIAQHVEGYVYFIGDFDGTVAGSHYFLYR